MFTNFKVGTRLFFMTAFSLLVTIVIALLGVRSMWIMNEEMNALYTESTEPLIELGDLNGQIMAINLELFRALQHDPKIEISKSHSDHDIIVHQDKIESRLKAVDELWKKYLATNLSEADKVLIKDFEASFFPYRNDYILPTLSAFKKGDFSFSVVDHFIKGNRVAGLAMEKSLVELLDLQGSIAKNKIETSNSAYQAAKVMMSVVFGICFLLSIFIAYVVVNRIVKQLSTLQSTITHVEESGDFTQRAHVSGNDELAQTGHSFNKLLNALQSSFGAVLKQANNLDQASSSLLLAAKESAQGSEITSESASAMAASIEEMMVGISNISENAKGTAEVTRHAGELSRAGTKVIHQTVEEMQAMADAVHKSSDMINALGQQSERISSIVQVIKDVADQTNLLALNAAIEAARAGEQGRGFAVVADEVRKLAERTTGATVEIGSMIDGLQKSSDSAVSAMKLAAERVQTGVTLAEQAGKAITEIQGNSDMIQTHVNDITASLAEQTIAGQTIGVQVERVAQAAEQNTAIARNSSELASNIEQLGKALNDEVVKFKV